MTRRSSQARLGLAGLCVLASGACSAGDQTDDLEPCVPPGATATESGPSSGEGALAAVTDASIGQVLTVADSEAPVPNRGYVCVQDVIVGEVSLGGQAEIIIRCFPPDTPPPFEAKALLQLSTYGVSLVSEIVEATEEEDEYRMLITIPPTFEPDDVPPGTYEIWVTCDPNWDVYSAFDLTLTGT